LKINIIKVAKLLGSFVFFLQRRKQREREELARSVERFKKEQGKNNDR